MPFLAMELLPGADLEALLRSGEELLLAEKLEVVVQVCRGLAYAHEHGVVHRDIKPSNIRILDDGSAKIMDFGIAKFGSTHITKTGMMVGTIHYMSPEQVRGMAARGRAQRRVLPRGDPPRAPRRPEAVSGRGPHRHPLQDRPRASRAPRRGRPRARPAPRRRRGPGPREGRGAAVSKRHRSRGCPAGDPRRGEEARWRRPARRASRHGETAGEGGARRRGPDPAARSRPRHPDFDRGAPSPPRGGARGPGPSPAGRGGPTRRVPRARGDLPVGAHVASGRSRATADAGARRTRHPGPAERARGGATLPGASVRGGRRPRGRRPRPRDRLSPLPRRTRACTGTRRVLARGGRFASGPFPPGCERIRPRPGAARHEGHRARDHGPPRGHREPRWREGEGHDAARRERGLDRRPSARGDPRRLRLAGDRPCRGQARRARFAFASNPRDPWPRSPWPRPIPWTSRGGDACLPRGRFRRECPCRGDARS